MRKRNILVTIRACPAMLNQPVFWCIYLKVNIFVCHTKSVCDGIVVFILRSTIVNSNEACYANLKLYFLLFCQNLTFIYINFKPHNVNLIVGSSILCRVFKLYGYATYPISLNFKLYCK